MELVRLLSGREILIRPIRHDDAIPLRVAFEALSTDARYQRFLAVKPHLSSTEVRYLVDVDGANHVALIATTADAAGEIVGVGRFVRLMDPRCAEIAVVVADRFQGEGIATELIERLVDAAVERGISRFHASVLAANEPVHQLVQRLARRSARIRQSGTLDEIEIELVHPDDTVPPDDTSSGRSRAPTASPTR